MDPAVNKADNIDLNAEISRLSRELEQALARNRRLADELSASRSEVSRLQAQIDAIVKRAHQEANERDWCPEFDDVMEELGLPRRKREYHVEVDVLYRVTVCVDATSEDAAWEQVDADHDLITNEIDVLYPEDIEHRNTVLANDS